MEQACPVGEHLCWNDACSEKARCPPKGTSNQAVDLLVEAAEAVNTLPEIALVQAADVGAVVTVARFGTYVACRLDAENQRSMNATDARASLIKYGTPHHTHPAGTRCDSHPEIASAVEGFANLGGHEHR